MAVKKILLIRHAKTQGNIERRYIGDAEEPLCPQGVKEAKNLARGGLLPPISRLLTGPARRCRQTAELLFPQTPYTLCPLSEIDFGVFKGKNADELLDDPDYARWLATDCEGDIPGGDSVSAFKDRCCEIFAQINTGFIEDAAQTYANPHHAPSLDAAAIPMSEKKCTFRSTGSCSEPKTSNRAQEDVFGSEYETTALILHSGNIMAIMERFGLPKKDFYDYHIPNCGFLLCRWEGEALITLRQGGAV